MHWSLLFCLFRGSIMVMLSAVNRKDECSIHSCGARVDGDAGSSPAGS